MIEKNCVGRLSREIAILSHFAPSVSFEPRESAVSRSPNRTRPILRETPYRFPWRSVAGGIVRGASVPQKAHPSGSKTDPKVAIGKGQK